MNVGSGMVLDMRGGAKSGEDRMLKEMSFFLLTIKLRPKNNRGNAPTVSS